MPSGDAHRLCKLGVSAPNPAARPVVKLHCQILIQVLVSYHRLENSTAASHPMAVFGASEILDERYLLLDLSQYPGNLESELVTDILEKR